MRYSPSDGIFRFFVILYLTTSLSLKILSSGKMIDLWRHSGCEIIQSSLRGLEIDGENVMKILQETRETYDIDLFWGSDSLPVISGRG